MWLKTPAHVVVWDSITFLVIAKMNYTDKLFERYPELEVCREAVQAAAAAMITCYSRGGKILVCGNGGSAADALHIVGELMKSFVLPRTLVESERAIIEKACPDSEYLCRHLQRALPAIALVNEVSLQTAYANDVAADLVFAQQVYGYGRKEDILFCISTSGDSANVVYAAEIGRAKNMTVISLTGEGGGRLKNVSDILIAVPEKETFLIQELHIPVYHSLCLRVEDYFFGEK